MMFPIRFTTGNTTWCYQLLYAHILCFVNYINVLSNAMSVEISKLKKSGQIDTHGA